MNITSDQTLKDLGFKLEPLVTDECDNGFTYRVASIQVNNSFIEVINEYRNGKLSNQFANYEIVDETSKVVDISFIKKLIQVIKNPPQEQKHNY